MPDPLVILCVVAGLASEIQRMRTTSRPLLKVDLALTVAVWGIVLAGIAVLDEDEKWRMWMYAICFVLLVVVGSIRWYVLEHKRRLKQ